MGRVTYEKLKEMQMYPSRIRNICILAHVDHGKTSIADVLLSTNAILSKRQAGLLRYLDSRPDEQRRGITMKSSTVALCYTVESTNEDFLVNIIDSPGHIDFASEVSAAAKISDGSLIVVDVVEGMCAQTVTALETAVREKTQMILVLNKMDRLFLEKCMDTEEIYLHLTILLETINACVADIRFKELSLQFEELGDLEQANDEFNPNAGNVIFASAIDGWAFRISDFAHIYSKQLNKPVPELISSLWGDFYYDKKSKTFLIGARELGKKTIFITMILDNILSLYENIVITKNDDKITKIIEKLSLKNKTREMSSPDKRVQLRAIISEWLPLAETVLSSVVQFILSPAKISVEKSNHVLGKDILDYDENNKKIEPYIKSCSSENAPTIVYVTKVYAIDRRSILSTSNSRIPSVVDIQTKREAVRRLKQNMKEAQEIKKFPISEIMKMSSLTLDKEEDKLDFIACVRIFSGTLKLGDELYLLPSSHSVNDLSTLDNINGDEVTMKIKIEELFMLLGKDVVKIEQSVAGNIIGIGGLKNYTIRTGTLSSTLECVPLIETRDAIIEPFYKCALEPKQISDMPGLLLGVKLLIQSDSCAQCVLQENGQYVLMTAGHVHLEKCIEDLKNFTGLDFKLSSPMVQLRETVVLPANKTEAPYKSKILLELGIKIQISAYPMPSILEKFVTQNFALLKKIEFTKDDSEITDDSNKYGTEKVYKNVYTSNAIYQLKKQFEQTFLEAQSKWVLPSNRVVSIGDTRNDCCMLMNFSKDFEGRSIFHKTDPNDPVTYLYKSIVNGFQLAIRAGPICDEPIKNVLFSIKQLEFTADFLENRGSLVTGIILKEVKDLVHKTFPLMQSRLMEPIYSARMTIDTNMTGKIQNRLEQHRGRITEANLVAKGLTDVEFIVPVLESPDFCDRLRADTQGKINPLLQFSHFELIDLNPYNISTATEDDDEDETEMKNLANKLMNDVRKRKGLRVDEKIVDYAEKQRTMNKKK